MPFEVDFLVTYNEESIIGELKRVAALLGKDTVSAKDLDEHGRVKYHMVIKHFGSLRRALEAAGLNPSRFTNARDAELIKLAGRFVGDYAAGFGQASADGGRGEVRVAGGCGNDHQTVRFLEAGVAGDCECLVGTACDGSASSVPATSACAG